MEFPLTEARLVLGDADLLDARDIGAVAHVYLSGGAQGWCESPGVLGWPASISSYRTRIPVGQHHRLDPHSQSLWTARRHVLEGDGWI